MGAETEREVAKERTRRSGGGKSVVENRWRRSGREKSARGARDARAARYVFTRVRSRLRRSEKTTHPVIADEDEDYSEKELKGLKALFLPGPGLGPIREGGSTREAFEIEQTVNAGSTDRASQKFQDL